MKILFSTRQISEQESELASQVDLYGFKKVFIALTNYGKITAFSSYNGEFLWNSNYHGEQLQKIMVRKHYVREDDYTEQQVVSIFSDSIKFMNAATGAELYHTELQRPAD